MPTIVMTGGTSGFGAAAAEHLASSTGTRLIQGARRPAPLGESLFLDLADLGSVRAFASSVREALGDRGIDALILNGGVICPDAAGRTVDGFETTFAVNHLAHYLLLRLLMPVLADGAIVVLTTSGTHDPASRAGLALPRHANAHLLAHSDRDPDLDPRSKKSGEHAYTASKLCAVLTARSLSRHPDAQARLLTAIAYCPGQVFGTGLAKNLSLPLRFGWALLGTPALSWPLRKFNRYLNSREAAGKALADLAIGVEKPESGHIYAALRQGRLTWPDPSNLAQSNDLALALWRDSAKLAGLT